MFKSVKEKWLVALRSNQYPQGKKQLRPNEGYCCLGVLATIVDPEQNTWTDDGMYFATTAMTGQNASVDQTKLIGSPIPHLQGEQLVEMNDGNVCGVSHQPSKSFKEIADWIEIHIDEQPDPTNIPS